MNTQKIFIPFLCFILFFFSAFSSTASSNEIKERMMQRLQTINDLKKQQIVGENNKGYLELRQKAGNHQNIVDQENNDRKAVYTAIAKKQGATIQFVGQRRALQIVEIADPGTWLQDTSGNWYIK